MWRGGFEIGIDRREAFCPAPILEILPFCHIPPLILPDGVFNLRLVKVLIEMSPEHYDLFVAECDIKSREYSVLKNAVITRAESSDEQRKIEILCDEEEARGLLSAATRIYPEAIPAIKAGLDLVPEL